MPLGPRTMAVVRSVAAVAAAAAGVDVAGDDYSQRPNGTGHWCYWPMVPFSIVYRCWWQQSISMVRPPSNQPIQCHLQRHNIRPDSWAWYHVHRVVPASVAPAAAAAVVVAAADDDDGGSIRSVLRRYQPRTALLEQDCPDADVADAFVPNVLEVAVAAATVAAAAAAAAAVADALRID
uniref:Putative secreted peptide n=1 Tax=Anopheles braziliensis TaxID=58242 RepID=A0A2M3ZMV9_9DIPT